MRTISLCVMGSPYANFLAIPAHLHTGIPICIRRSLCKIMHMGIQDSISHMEIFPVCIRLVTEKSPYAYRDAQIPICIRGFSVHATPVCIRGFARPCMHKGIKINSRMHTGITCLAISVCMWGLSCDPCMHTGICVIPICIQGIDL